MCHFDENGRKNCISLDSDNSGFYINRDMWVMPMLGLSTLNVLVILAFEIFVICKATGNSPSRRYSKSIIT